jgi:hypothetical protein
MTHAHSHAPKQEPLDRIRPSYPLQPCPGGCRGMTIPGRWCRECHAKKRRAA